MPRRRVVVRREIMSDPRYKSGLASKFINCLMLKGKKSLAESIFYGAMDIIKQKTGDDPLKIFMQAVKNAEPLLEVKSRRVGGATYQVPVDVRLERRTSLAIRWIIRAARARDGKTMKGTLAAELMDAARNEGAAIKKKEETHKMAEANKAFAHYRW